MRTDLPLNSPASLGILCARVFAPLAILAAALGAAQIPAAQAPTTPAPHATAHKPAQHTSAQHKPAHPHKHSIATKPQPPATPVVVVPATPAAPEVPAWPANDKPTPAAVVWDSQGLRIDADNSSLKQILKDLAIATGATVEGLEADQRVFGAYGPGPAREVLSQLLQGSGYNVLLVGDQGQGTPRQIILSSSHAGTTGLAVNPAPASASDEDTETEEQPQPAQPHTRPPFRQPHTPPGQQP